MGGFTIIDGVVALVIIVSALLAYYRGFVRETLSICGWILAAVLAYLLAPTVEPLVKEIPVVRSVLGNSCELALIFAFAVVFAASLIVDHCVDRNMHRISFSLVCYPFPYLLSLLQKIFKYGHT